MPYAILSLTIPPHQHQRPQLNTGTVPRSYGIMSAHALQGGRSMPLFKYWALDKAGKTIIATMDAAGTQEVKELLRNRNLIPARIIEFDQRESVSWWRELFAGTVELKTKVAFTRQLSVLLKAGIPLLEAMTLLIDQFEGYFKRVLIKVKDDLKEGKALADAMSGYPKIFNNVYIQLVRAGEASGGLEKILDRLTTQLERSDELNKKISGAMIGPILMISLAVGLMVAASLWVIPSIANMLTEMNIPLPGITEAILTFSHILTNYWYFIIAAIAFTTVLFMRWKSTPTGKHRLHGIILAIPVVAQVSKTKAVVQFSNTLGMLLEAGVNLSEALDIVCNIVENQVLVEHLREARLNIIKKGKIAKFLKETGMFPAVANYMIQTGEESGNLAEMLLQVGSDYETSLIETTDALTAALSPIMTFVVAGVAVIIALALFLPMTQMTQGLDMNPSM